MLQRAICYRPFVCPSVGVSVCLSHGWISQKRLKLGSCIMQLSPQSSPMTLVSRWLTSPRNYKGNTGSGGAKWERGRKNTQFSANKSPYLRNGARYDQGYNDGLIGSRICAFDWCQNYRPWMTLNCYKFEFPRNFALLRIFGKRQRLNEWRQTRIVSDGIVAHWKYFSTMYSVSQKKSPPEVFWHFFPNGWEFF